MTAATEEIEAFETLMTDPDLLADYVNDYFGPEGPVPVETMQDRLAAEVEANAPYGYQRPQLEMPAPGVQSPVSADRFWEEYNVVMAHKPELAWQMLASAPPEVVGSKLFVADSPV